MLTNTMKKSQLIYIILALSMLLPINSRVGSAHQTAPEAEPVGAGFTYQGQLSRDGKLVSAACSLQFSLYDAAEGGEQVGASLTRSGVQVVNGVFTTTGLDFGESAFSGQARWLQVAVQCPGDASYANLLPRQALTAAPYAAYALQAAPTHSHFGQSWSGSGIGLSLSGGLTGLYASSSSFGIWAEANSSNGTGVRGEATASGGINYGVLGLTASTNGRGVQGSATASSGTTYGVYGLTASTEGRGVYGSASATSGNTYGVFGSSASSTGTGVYGEATATAGAGIRRGVVGSSASGTGVYGEATASTGTTRGVHGFSASTEGRGVYGSASATSGNTYGVFGVSTSPDGNGVRGTNVTPTGYGVYSHGRFAATGTKSFQIDHPLDPANQYLNHFSAEGPEPYLIYRGSAILDEAGQAWIRLPDYFESINRDFHYQLTPVGKPALLYIAEEVRDNRFLIAGGEAGMKVSWTVTGIRNDPFVRSYPLSDVQDKLASSRGLYLQPELHGQPESPSIHYTPRDRENEDDSPPSGQELVPSEEQP
jgi:hypothetical protein